MEYNAGDNVIYGRYGICRIVGKETRIVKEQKLEFYVLQPLYDEASTIFVPLDNEKLLGEMRCVLSEEEVYDIIRAMPEEKTIWIENENECREQYRKILQSGERRALVKMIKTLYLYRLSQREKGKNCILPTSVF